VLTSPKTLNGSNGFAINGIDARFFSGGSRNSAGDVNGDGFDDALLGAYFMIRSRSGWGELCCSAHQDSVPTSTKHAQRQQWLAINGIGRRHRSGFVVSSVAGDVNGDSFDDIIIGAKRADPNGHDSVGSSQVLYLPIRGFSATST